MMNDKMRTETEKAIEGKPWNEAIAIFGQMYQVPGAELRKGWEDGKRIPGNKDINYNRLTVGVKNGLVVFCWDEKYDADGGLISCMIKMWR